MGFRIAPTISRTIYILIFILITEPHPQSFAPTHCSLLSPLSSVPSGVHLSDPSSLSPHTKPEKKSLRARPTVASSLRPNLLHHRTSVAPRPSRHLSTTGLPLQRHRRPVAQRRASALPRATGLHAPLPTLGLSWPRHHWAILLHPM